MFNGGVLEIYLFFFILLLSAVKVKVTSIFFDRHIDRKVVQRFISVPQL